MIISFNEKINTFYKNNLKNLNLTQENVQDLMPTHDNIHCKCPKCNAKDNFSYHGAYNRCISFIRDDNTYDFYVSVTRVICNSCGSTHALLPAFIVPYKTFSLDSILYVITEVAYSSVLKTADKLNLSFQLIYSFLVILMSFFYHVDSLNREKKTYKNFNKTYFKLNCLIICNEEFLKTYFKHYNWIFLMTKYQNIKSPPIYININE